MATIAEQSSELRLATFRLSRRIRAEKSDEALSDGQIAVLGNLYRNGTQTLGQRAERERVSAPSMNRTVNCLEAGGHLTRGADDVDRRKVNIVLTETGRAVVKETISKRDAWLTPRLRELSREDREVLARAAELMGGLATL